MQMVNTQSPEADLDREIEELIGKKVRGVLAPDGHVKLIELQSMRARLMRPRGLERRNPGGVFARRYA